MMLKLVLQNGLEFRVTKYNVANGILNINIVIDIAFWFGKIEIENIFCWTDQYILKA